MAKGGGGGGSPSAFTGGMPSAVPGGGFSPSSLAPEPFYQSFLPSGGNEMATPESVGAAFSNSQAMAAQQQQAQQAAQRQAMAAQLAAQPQNPMRNMFSQLSGQELMGMRFGQQPQNFDPQAARNDSLMRIFAGAMPGRGGRSIGKAGGGAGRGSGSRNA